MFSAVVLALPKFRLGMSPRGGASIPRTDSGQIVAMRAERVVLQRACRELLVLRPDCSSSAVLHSSWWATTIATYYCPGRMSEHPKSMPTGGFNQLDGPPCTYAYYCNANSPDGNAFFHFRPSSAFKCCDFLTNCEKNVALPSVRVQPPSLGGALSSI